MYSAAAFEPNQLGRVRKDAVNPPGPSCVRASLTFGSVTPLVAGLPFSMPVQFETMGRCFSWATVSARPARRRRRTSSAGHLVEVAGWVGAGVEISVPAIRHCAIGTGANGAGPKDGVIARQWRVAPRCRRPAKANQSQSRKDELCGYRG